MKGFIKKWFNDNFTTKSADSESISPSPRISDSSIHFQELFSNPLVAGHNYMEMFYSIPEVFFSIDYIASRVAGANFQVKRVKDDSIVWANRTMNKLLARPNCLMTWREIIYSHMVYKLATGNSFMRAAMSDSFKESPKHKYCDNIWVLPSDNVTAIRASNRIPLYGVAELGDIIDHYEMLINGERLVIPSWQVWHDRDSSPLMNGDNHLLLDGGFMRSKSRMESLRKPISNLLAVYEARNVIYVKRGGLGFLIGQKQDATGSVPLTSEEKKDILKQSQDRYGLGANQSPYGISDVPLGFVRTNLSISDLQPFDETLSDAITIAGVFGIPAVLVPRKDQSTFSNQSTAEKAVYSSTIIPTTKNLCKGITEFLGLEENGLYLDCDFSDVDCLQIGLREAEQVKKMVNDRCEKQFKCGLITFNDWRAQIGESHLEGDAFDKVLFEMSEQELAVINRVFTNTQKGDNGKGNSEPSVQNEGK